MKKKRINVLTRKWSELLSYLKGTHQEDKDKKTYCFQLQEKCLREIRERNNTF